MYYPGQKVVTDEGISGVVSHVGSVAVFVPCPNGEIWPKMFFPDALTPLPDLPLDLLDKVADYIYHSTPCGTIGDAIENAKAILSLVLSYGGPNE